MTRWHGTPRSLQPRMMLPTARHARGRPASAAMSTAVATRPAVIRRTAATTRRRKSVSAANHDLDAEGDAAEVGLVEFLRDAVRIAAQRVRYGGPLSLECCSDPPRDAEFGAAKDVIALK